MFNFLIIFSKLSFYSNKQFLEILAIDELSSNEKNECKILISDYLNNPDLNKRFPAKNVNQLQYVVDFLIDYINNKERIYREKMGESLQGNILKLKSLDSEEERKLHDKLIEFEGPKELLDIESSTENRQNENLIKQEKTLKINENSESLNFNFNSNMYKKSSNNKKFK